MQSWKILTKKLLTMSSILRKEKNCQDHQESLSPSPKLIEAKKNLKTMEKQKGRFYLAQSLDANGKKVYLQRLVSPSSANNTPTITYVPEFALRGTSMLDVFQMRHMIKLSSGYIKNKSWKIVMFEMEVEVPSFAKTDFENNYVDLLYEQGIRRFSLSEKEKEEYESWKKTFKL